MILITKSNANQRSSIIILNRDCSDFMVEFLKKAQLFGKLNTFVGIDNNGDELKYYLVEKNDENYKNAVQYFNLFRSPDMQMHGNYLREEDV